MDKVTRYREIVQQVLESYAGQMSAGSPIHIIPVCDTTHDQYLLVSLGRQNNRREHAIVSHARLVPGRFIIEDDRTEVGIGDLLVKAGVDPAHIQASWAGRVSDQVSLVA
jgi:hypothetical protein